MPNDDKPKYAESDHAPHIPVDFVISGGFINGLIQVNVGSQDLRHNHTGKLEAVIVPSAHLRMTPWAAKELLVAIQQSLDMMTGASQKSVQRPSTVRQ